MGACLMAALFNGWGVSGGSAWGPIESNPGAIRGAASFRIQASITVNAGEMIGSASFAIVAGLDNRPRAGISFGGADAEDEIDEYREEVEKIIKHAKRRRAEEDEILASIINFVLEQA